MENKVLQIGDKAPDFQAMTTLGPLKLSDWKGKWIVFFSHPGDFTPVCTTEFIAFARMFPYFQQRNVYLLGLSVDSQYSHLAWIYNIYQMTGIEVPFPVISDVNMSIAKKYGMISPASGDTSPVRSVVIIDDKQVIRAILTYPKTTGRNIPEILRMIDALQTSDREHVVTPANWTPDQWAIIPPPSTYPELKERLKNQDGYHCREWYLCTRPLSLPCKKE
ncbi:MAG: peroxiredoxin [Epulopiscium sp.]|nr:peroxiredoxin [Candidatus Epulonipiscium sp.]